MVRSYRQLRTSKPIHLINETNTTNRDLGILCYLLPDIRYDG